MIRIGELLVSYVPGVDMNAQTTIASHALLPHKRGRENRLEDSPTALFDVDNAYQAIVNNPKYRHFINIPERIIRCLDYFEIEGNRELIHARLQSYYLFIGVVDDAIDSGQFGVGDQVLHYLEGKCRAPNDIESSIALIAQRLNHHIYDESLLEKFHDLHDEVLRERTATSVRSYIHQRKVVGTLTAELSYLLIRPLLENDSEDLHQFMREVGSIGCLIDSLIDLRSDYRSALVSFKPTIGDYAKLLFTTLRLGLRISLRHPRLCLLFLEATIDNFQDRIRRHPPHARKNLVSTGKDVASVA